MTNTVSRTAVLQALSRHIGARRAVSAEDLVREIASDVRAPDLFVDDRLLRKRVSELREEGVAVCAHPKLGYFIAETPEELDMCCRFLRTRAMHSLALESRLRNIPLPDLLGQLRVPT